MFAAFATGSKKIHNLNSVKISYPELLFNAMSATKEELTEFFKAEFPQMKMTILDVGNRKATIKHRIGFDELRPGKTVSGPVLMATADSALYVAIMGELGMVSMAVTTSLNFNFMHKPAYNKDIIGICSILKLGKSLAVGEVSLYSEGDDKIVAHAVGTYSIPVA